MSYTHFTLWGENSVEESPHATPTEWTPKTPLAILGEVEGHDPYNSAITVPNHRLSPAHPDLDETHNIVLRYARPS